LANLIVALIAIVVILAAMGSLASSGLTSQGRVADSFRELGNLTGEAARTGVASLGVAVLDAGATVEFTVRNSGETKLRGFDSWDLFISYQEAAGTGLQLQRLSYTASTSPAAGEWTVAGIFTDASASSTEIHEPGIVNPAEELVVRAAVSPSIAGGTSNSIALSVTNGVTVEAAFSN